MKQFKKPGLLLQQQNNKNQKLSNENRKILEKLSNKMEYLSIKNKNERIYPWYDICLGLINTCNNYIDHIKDKYAFNETNKSIDDNPNNKNNNISNEYFEKQF